MDRIILNTKDPKIGNQYLGNISAAKNLENIKTFNVKNIVSILSEEEISNLPELYRENDINHCIISANDSLDQIISPYLEETSDWIKEALKNGNVLVHCLLGISRSASFVISYLMYNKFMGYQVALDFVKNMRPRVNPNKIFEIQLKQQSKKLMIIEDEIPNSFMPFQIWDSSKHIESIPETTCQKLCQV